MGKIKIKCDYCGKTIEKYPCELKRAIHHFCNQKCQRLWLRGERSPYYKRIDVKCDNCGASLKRIPYRARMQKHHFCNKKCHAEWQSGESKGNKNPSFRGGKVKFICDNCGKISEKWPYEIKKNRKHHFCDLKCFGEWQSRVRRGDKSPCYKVGKIKVECDNCGKISEKYPSDAKKYKHHFCNRECQAEWASKDKDTQEYLRRIRSATGSPTKPELIFKEICERNNLPFKYTGDGQLWIGKKKKLNPDFIESNGKRIIVEIMGAYWHSPILNKNIPTHGTLKYRKAHYKRFKWIPIFIWDTDLLREDAEQFVLNLLERGLEK